MDRYRIKYIVFAIVALLAGAWFYTLDLSSDSRIPGKREIFFQYAAVAADVPELCEKISTDAIVVSGFGSDGRRIYSSRSQCFYQTAVRHSNRLLCLKVKSISNIFHWGYKISTLGCLLEIGEKKRRRLLFAISPDDKMVMAMFSEMGYSVDDVVNALPLKPMVNPKRAFRRLTKQPNFIQRLKAALELKNKIPIEDYELILIMLAKRTHDINLCKTIRPGIRHPAEKKSEKKWSLDFRGSCILQVAIGSGNEKYCAELPNKPAYPDQHHIWWPANDCRSSVRFELKRKKRFKFYGTHVPEDEKQILRLFRLLGGDLPMDSDQPIFKLADRYRYLLVDIGNGEISRDDPGAKILLQRLKQLGK